MEEQKSNESSKVGTFLSSAANKVLNLIMILIIIALAALVAWFWHQNELLQNDIKNLNEKVEDFEKMSSMDESRDVVVGGGVEEKVKDNVIESDDKVIVDSNKKSANAGSEIKSPNLNDWENAEWKIYKDEENGFEISYPDTFSFRTGMIDSKNKTLEHIDTMRYIKEWTDKNRGPISLDLSVEISVMDNKNKLSLKDWFNQGNSDIKSSVLIEDYIVKNENVLRVSENSIMSNDAIFFLLKNGKIVKFHVNGMTIDHDDRNNFFIKMIDSVKIY